MRAAFRQRAQGLYHWRSGRIVRFALVPAHGRGTVRNARARGGRSGGGGGKRGYGAPFPGLRQLRPVPRFRGSRRPVPAPGGGVMIGSISGTIKAKAALMDPSHYGRSDTSAMGRWFWEIDKILLHLITLLIAIGLTAVAAASPAAATRYSGGNVHVSELYYFYRQLAWIALGVPVMIGISMMPRERLRRWSIAGALLFLILLAVVPILGEEKNGAVRWLNIGVGQLQPSEFLKPFFVVAMAWLLSLREGDKSLPVYWLSAAITGVIAFLLMQQPDFGSTIIFCAVLIACLAIALLYLGSIARVLIKLLDEDNSLAILAGAGLVIQFGLQALINMMVNVQLAPSKGMTLPFISYGGSSMLALSIAMGLLLAFTRRNPYLTRSPYVVKWSGESLTA